MLLTSKLFSLVVAVGYMAGAVSSLGWTPDIWLISAVLTMPLALIWFPEEMGELAGSYRVRIRQSPATLVTTAGWLFLSSMPVIFCLIRQT